MTLRVRWKPRGLNPGTPDRRTKAWQPGVCANCDEPLPVSGNPRTFCSERCRQYTKDVRYFRRCIVEGRFRDPDVQAALQTRLAHLVAGGYDEAARRLPAAVRAEVLAANGGMCCHCGVAPAAQVDHIDGPSAERSNLQGLCAACHDAKTRASMRPIGELQLAARDAFILRVEADPPVRACDDPYEWGKGKAERRAAASAWQWEQRPTIDVSIQDPRIEAFLRPDEGDDVARTTRILIEDDLTGEVLDEGRGETIHFGLDGQEYEIDLSGDNARELREAVKRYVDAGRRVGPRGRGRSTASGAGARRARGDGQDRGAIRAWAKEHGHAVSERGRIAQSVVDAYNAAH